MTKIILRDTPLSGAAPIGADRAVAKATRVRRRECASVCFADQKAFSLRADMSALRSQTTGRFASPDLKEVLRVLVFSPTIFDYLFRFAFGTSHI